ncbi:hypothetical protein [Phormidesmis priestleyi]
MKSSDPLTSACRHCRYYMPEGRRGGHCSQLSVSVQGSWTACSLARPVFASTWDFTKIRIWKEESLETHSLPTMSELNTTNLREASRAIALDTLARPVSSEKLTA